MEYAADDLTPHERYKLLAGFVLPRPIVWVTTVGPTGVVNAAPYSFFNVFCEDPPLCMFAVNPRPDGRAKDTLVNVRRTGEFVVNLTDEPLEHVVFFRNRDSQLGEFLIQTPCWGTGASMDDATLFGRHSRTHTGAGCSSLDGSFDC